MPDRDTARRFAWAALAVYLVALAVAATLRVQGDFATYYIAGGRAARGEPIYRLDDRNLFLYAPVFAICFAPLAMLPLRAAQGAWFIVNACALLASLFGAGQMLFGRRRLPASLVVVPVVLSARFIDNNIEHGQINLVALALVVWAIVATEADRSVAAGAMLSAAVLIKPFALLGALYLALRRRFDTLGYAMVAGAILLVLPAAWFGARGTIEQTGAYMRSVASMTGRYRVMLTNQSAAAMLARLTDGGGAVSLFGGTAIEMVLVAAVSLWILQSPVRAAPAGGACERLPLCGLFCLMPSFAPVSWKSYYATLLVPYMALVSTLWIDRRETQDPSALARGLLLVSVALNFIPGRNLNRVALFYSAHLWSSLMALAALVVASRSDRKHRSETSVAIARARPASKS